jgi:hypothetical protein
VNQLKHQKIIRLLLIGLIYNSSELKIGDQLTTQTGLSKIIDIKDLRKQILL